MQDIGTQDAVLARQCVDHDFRTGCAIREIEERATLPRLPVPTDFRGGVEARGRQRNPTRKGHRGDFLEGIGRTTDLHGIIGKDHRRGIGLVFRGQPIRDACPDRIAGRLDRHAVQIRARRRRRRRRIRHLGGIRCRHLHARQIASEPVRRDLCDFRMQPLPHLGATVVQMDRPVGIDMHQSARLVKMSQGERNPEFHRRQGDPPFQHRIHRIPFRHPRPPRVVVAACGQPVGHRTQTEVSDRLPVVRPPRLCSGNIPAGGSNFASCIIVEIQSPHLQRIAFQDMGNMVHHPLDPEHALRPTETAKGGGGLCIGPQPPAFDCHDRDVIGVVGV